MKREKGQVVQAEQERISLQYSHHEFINTILNEGELSGQSIGEIDIASGYIWSPVCYDRGGGLTGSRVIQLDPGPQGQILMGNGIGVHVVR